MGSFLGASANEYLNYEFGWRPFVDDFRNFYKLSKSLDTMIAKLVLENNTNIRRRANFGTTTKVEEIATWHKSSWNFPVFNCGGADGFPAASGKTHITATITTTTDTWFVAGYRYFIPDTQSWLWFGKAVSVLFGVYPSPELLYNITPWTWLADWWVDLGSFYSYLSPTAVENLVTRYAFTMRKVRTVEEWTASTTLNASDYPNLKWKGDHAVLRSLHTKVTKQRGSGWSPFGAFLSPLSTSLTPKQIGILAALGISRAT
jgi:hypothetical protein